MQILTDKNKQKINFDLNLKDEETKAMQQIYLELFY